MAFWTTVRRSSTRLATAHKDMDKFRISNRILSDILLDGDNINEKKIYDYITFNFNFNEVQVKVIQQKIYKTFMPIFKKKI